MRFTSVLNLVPPPPLPPARSEASRDSWCGQPLPAPPVCRQQGSEFLNPHIFRLPCIDSRRGHSRHTLMGRKKPSGKFFGDGAWGPGSVQRVDGLRVARPGSPQPHPPLPSPVFTHGLWRFRTFGGPSPHVSLPGLPHEPASPADRLPCRLPCQLLGVPVPQDLTVSWKKEKKKKKLRIAMTSSDGQHLFLVRFGIARSSAKD